MPLTPQELKDKLLRTLDKDYNVVDMAGAREALSILEKYPINRETLEQTRLGRYVNEMRKKTADREFAKRIKNLVRKWQVLITPGTPAIPPAESATAPEPPARVNGKAPMNARLLDGHSHLKGFAVSQRPASPASRPETPCSVRSNISSPRSTHGMAGVSAGRRDGVDTGSAVREGSAVATSLARCTSETPLSSSRSTVASPLVGHTAVASQHRVHNAKLHSAPTTPMNSTNLGGQSTTGSAANNVATSKKRKREEEPSGQPGIKLKIMKKSSTIESEVVLKDRIPSTTPASSDTWSCTSETVARKPPNANGMLASLPDASTPPSSASVPPNAPQVKSRIGRPPNSAGRKAAVTLDRGSSLVSTTPVNSAASRAESTTVSRPDTPATSALPTFVPKVATTAELIQKLHASGDLRLTASETVKKIASNQIVKETLSENDSVVPAAAKPRPRKKNSIAMPPSTPDMMTMVQIKNEMVHKFLESSVPPDSPSNNSLMNLLKRLDPPPDPDAPLFNDHSTSKLSQSASPGPIRTADNSRDPVALDSPWDSLPPVDPDQIDWSTTEYVAPDPEARPPVTDDDVERLHMSPWPGVNGQYDFRNEWSDWTKTFSVSSYNGDLLHILPYVNIRD